MKSRASFFDLALARNMLRRRWPFWLAVFVFFYIPLPMPLINAAQSGVQGSYDHLILNSLDAIPEVCAILCLLTALLQFSFLYNTRSCGLMNTLPLRRVTVFGTAWLMGLMPLLILEALGTLLTCALTLIYPVKAATLLLWLAVMVCCTLCFYGVASFCAMLTGNVLVLPAVYAVLNVVAPVLKSCFQTLRSTLSFGFVESYEHLLDYFCPGGILMLALNRARWAGAGAPNMTAPVVYALIGLLLSWFALRLYQKRRMETATDTVAIACLKPVFLYCMAFGTALVLPWALTDMLNSRLGYGRGAYCLVLLLMLLGAAVGWFAGRMVLEKSVRVFRGRWKGLLIVCLVLVLLCSVIEFDLVGFETRVPEVSQVESVSLNSGAVLREEENIAAAVALHRNILAHKAEFDRENLLVEGGDGAIGSMFIIRYRLKNGGYLSRRYSVFGTVSQLDDPASPVAQYAALMNTQEALESQAIFTLPVQEETVTDAYIAVLGTGSRSNYNRYTLTQAQAVDFYENALLPDLREGKIARFTYGAEGIEYSNLEFYLCLASPEEAYPELAGESGVMRLYMSNGPTWDEPTTALWENKFYQLPLDAGHCLQWIRDNTEIEPELSDISVSRFPYGVG